jgi:hypothetical protein
MSLRKEPKKLELAQQKEYDRRGKPGLGLSCEQAHVINMLKSGGQDCFHVVKDEEESCWYLQNGLNEIKIEAVAVLSVETNKHVLNCSVQTMGSNSIIFPIDLI